MNGEHSNPQAPLAEDDRFAFRKLPDEPAFPAQEQFDGGTCSGPLFVGLTKRELFAAMAMQALADHYTQGGEVMCEIVARISVECADALLKELSK